ncbi:unnamed protein product [Nezara viridula]|uniref:Uncharacterized protein n=1 Tax=Nezara viridula TaxID=85310 RepID=A0A9P0H500_NEZVI|nr:unnamed protein product [Nezara viridula]
MLTCTLHDKRVHNKVCRSMIFFNIRSIKQSHADGSRVAAKPPQIWLTLFSARGSVAEAPSKETKLNIPEAVGSMRLWSEEECLHRSLPPDIAPPPPRSTGSNRAPSPHLLPRRHCCPISKRVRKEQVLGSPRTKEDVPRHELVYAMKKCTISGNRRMEIDQEHKKREWTKQINSRDLLRIEAEEKVDPQHNGE